MRQSLGAIQLLRGDLSAAEHTFRQSLIRVRNNGWSLFGLREVYHRSFYIDDKVENCLDVAEVEGCRVFVMEQPYNLTLNDWRITRVQKLAQFLEAITGVMHNA